MFLLSNSFIFQEITMYKKIISIAICAVIGVSVCGCSGSDSKSSSVKDTAVSSSVSELTAKDILEKAASDTMTQKAFFEDEKFQNNISKLYGIEADKLEDGGIVYGDNGSADEISVIRLKDENSAKKVLEARVEYRATQFQNYKPSEMPKINAAEIFEEGGYWFLIIADDPGAIHQTIDEMM